MPELDGISQNPKRPIKKKSQPGNPLPAGEAARRRKLMWIIVVLVAGVILVAWFLTIGSSINSTTGDNSAWETLKRKVSGLTSVFRKETGDDKIKEIDVNSPTPEQIQYLREQVFPEANQQVTNNNSSSNENVNNSVNLNTNGS